LCLLNILCEWTQEGECVVKTPGDTSGAYGTGTGVFRTPTDDLLPFYRTDEEDADDEEDWVWSYGICASYGDRGRCIADDRCTWDFNECLDPIDTSKHEKDDNQHWLDHLEEENPKLKYPSKISLNDLDDKTPEELGKYLEDGLTPSDFPGNLERVLD